MKKLLLLIIAIFTLFGCVENSQRNISKKKCNKVTSNFGVTYNVIEVDSCEYLVKHTLFTDEHERERDIISITHKGNCKYCQKRNREMIKDILTSIDSE